MWWTYPAIEECRKLYHDDKKSIEEIAKFFNAPEDSVRRILSKGQWIYWDGWYSNHDLRIDDAVCSECGYKHPTVRWEQGDALGNKAYETVLNKLANECPKCGVLMRKVY